MNKTKEKCHSKKVKLPKYLWVKGKSKFLFPRLREEFGTVDGKSINDLIV